MTSDNISRPVLRGIAVQVHDGVIALEGTVTTWKSLKSVVATANRAYAVHDVSCQIRVDIRGGQRNRAHDVDIADDVEIASAVGRALAWNVPAPDAAIRATVSSGWVILEGTVTADAQAKAVCAELGHLRDVQGVVNRLELVPPVAVQSSNSAGDDGEDRYESIDFSCLAFWARSVFFQVQNPGDDDNRSISKDDVVERDVAGIRTINEELGSSIGAWEDDGGSAIPTC